MRRTRARLATHADLQEINAAREAFFDAFNSVDLDAFMGWVSSDAVFMNHAGPPPLMGKDAIRSAYKAFFAGRTPNLAPSSDETIVSGDWAFDRGTWRSIKSDKRGVPRECLESCYVMIWRRSPEGGWTLGRSTWNGADVRLNVGKTGKRRSTAKATRRRSRGT